MPGSKSDFDFDTTTESDTRDALRPKSSEDRANQFGTRIALLVLCIGLFRPWYQLELVREDGLRRLGRETVASTL